MHSCKPVILFPALALSLLPRATSQELSAASSVAVVESGPISQKAGAASAARGGIAGDDYIIGAGDILQVSVWKEPDASVPSVVVRPDGKIAMPLLKDVAVAGLTPAQAEKTIGQKLGPMIRDAEIAVIVLSIRSKKVYVLGGVKKEGPIPYNYRMTVLQAISEAGGLTEYAKRSKIYVLRTENGRTSRLLFNYDKVTNGEKMDENVQLQPGDTIVVRQ